MKILYSIILSFLLLTTSLLHGQEEDESCLAPNKKAQKALDKAKSGSGDIMEISKLLTEAIALDEENATPYFEFGLFAYESGSNYYRTDNTPSRGDRSFEKSEEMFKKALDYCPDIHADAFYFLGVINLTQKNKKEALVWFEKFKGFEHEDNTRYPNDYDSKLKTVNNALKEIKTEVNLLEKEVPFNPSVVQNVSSTNDEYFPMISPDNELIFYTRKLDRRNLGDLRSNIKEEFTKSERKDIYSLFDNGKPVEAPFNNGSMDGYGAATLSIDNKEMIVTGCKYIEVQGQKYKNCDLYSTTYERDENGKIRWTALQNLGSQINTQDGWESQPTLSANGNTLYFTAIRPTTAMDDIFISQRNEDGSWGAAEPFIEINTPGKDKSPFLHQDSETLYFVSSVSEQRKGIGGTDIFYTRKKEDGSWDTPINIGYPINTQDDEIGIFVSTNGTEAYYSSRQGGKWNIYSFELYPEARPKAVFIAKGSLENESGEPITNATIEVSYANKSESETIRVNGNDGKYAVVVKADEPQDVMLTVKKEGHAFDSKIIEKETVAENKTVRNSDLTLRKIEVGKPYTINDILYNTASADLSKRSQFVLKQFAKFLKDNPTIKITIQGHTDDEGDNERNLKLSQERADGVKAYLVNLGVNKERMIAKGFGETQPKAPNTSENNKAQNRRTDFVIEQL